MNLDFQNQDMAVAWCGGGVLVTSADTTLLLDCPPGVENFLPCRGATVAGLILTSGRPQAVGGLVGFLSAASQFREGGGELSIYASAGEERGPALVECWQRFWRGGFAVHVDVNVPGRGFCVGPFDVRVDGIAHGEPDWQSNRVVPAVGVAISLKVGKTRIVWVPGAAPRPQLAYLCRDADLAIIEAGQTPWPPSEMAWRLDESQARVAGAEAARVWLVDDEGRRLSSARA